jgi:phosphoribosylformylglycinamidine cyclo-ligase
MPGFYADGEYDVAGFIVGVVPRRHLVDGRSIAPGDVLIGLPSSGLHTNGYSLARRIAFEVAGLNVDDVIPALGRSIGEALLAPHRSYLSVVRPLLDRGPGFVKGMAHITGGGITDNLPRVLPPGTHARIDRSTWDPPAVFRWLQQAGGVPDADMLRTFNMGIGLIVACAPDRERELIAAFAGAGEPGAVRIGEIRAGGEGVVYE